jgi:signal transduction histidine kinase/DNA-binding response OmpR family regulator
MSDSDKVNILVVDDLPDKLLVFRSILEELGQNVMTAQSGREALRQMLDRDFAVVLLDVNMPDINGFETAALIRQRKRTAHTPIIFITAFSDEMHTARGYSLGAVDYILSPVVPEILRTKVGVFVDLFRMSEQVKRQAEERVALAREQAARAAAEETTRRSLFLAEASTILVSSLDYEAILPGLARLLVPFLADVSLITLADEQGQPGQTAMAWNDPDKGTITSAVVGHCETPAALAEVIRRVLTIGKMEVLAETGPGQPPPAVAEKKDPGEGKLILPAFALKSAAIFPLVASRKILGALALAKAHSGRSYGPADIALAEDVAGRAAIALDNARLYRNIQEQDRRKNEFLAMLAHELRNPLAPLRNGVEILKQPGQQGDDIEWIRGMIDRQVRHLVRLVDDLLDVSRITRGKIQLRKEPVDVSSIVSCAVEASRPLIDSRRHKLTVHLPDCPVQVDADPTRLTQVLGNLLNNAAKYTEEGGRIGLSVEEEGRDVVFRVRDSGIGIPPEMLPSVFDLFMQANRGLDRSQGGLGIGLTLVHRLVEMHGGKVQALSAGPGKGSEFVIRLPVLTEELRRSVLANGDGYSPAESPRQRVLLVDDNPDGAGSLATVLRRKGHEVHVCPDGPSALTAAESFRPGIVLLDIGLPGMNGYEVARRMRQQSILQNTRLVALTGYGQEEDRRRSLEAGFDQHLIKPVDLTLLDQLLAEV